MKPYVMNKFVTSRFRNVKETTEILQLYGLSKNEKKTRELIRSKRLVARKEEGVHEDDRRSGYVISEKAIYDFIVESIPIMKEIFEELKEDKPKGTIKTAKKKSEEDAATK